MPKIPRVAVSRGESAPSMFASTDLSRVHFPGREFLYSLVIHGIALAVLLVSPLNRELRESPEWQLQTKDDHRETMIVYLPKTGGGRQGRTGKLGSPGPKVASISPSGKKGLVYPGPQQIVSDSPEPTSRIQTLIQPELGSLPILKEPVELPNLISIPDLGLDLQPSLPRLAKLFAPPAKPESLMPIKLSDGATMEPVRKEREDLPSPRALADLPNLISLAEAAAVSPPTLRDLAVGLADPDRPEEQLPVLLSDGAAMELVELELEDLPSARPLENFPNLNSLADLAPISVPPRPEPSLTEADPPQAEEEQPLTQSDSAITEADRTARALDSPPEMLIDTSKWRVPASLPLPKTELNNLLSLTPIPPIPAQQVSIPKAEARGRFAISPESNLEPSETDPGSLSEPSISGQASSAGGNVTQGRPPSIVTITWGSSGSGNGNGSSTGGDGSGMGGSDSGSGSGTGPGSGSGSGSGSSGSGSGSGSGQGGGPGSSSGVDSNRPFSGITVIGGVGGTPKTPNSVLDRPLPNPVQTAYSVFVLSTEHSGGGLPSFGVFSNQQVYTVFLDMREAEFDLAKSWTLEFSVAQETANWANIANRLDDGQPGLVPPFPTVKEKPALPRELVSRHIGRMVIVFALINVEGGIEQISVMQSPDPLLNEPVLDALSKWVFRPAVLNGAPVAVKALLGIPLWLPPPGSLRSLP